MILSWYLISWFNHHRMCRIMQRPYWPIWLWNCCHRSNPELVAILLPENSKLWRAHALQHLLFSKLLLQFISWNLCWWIVVSNGTELCLIHLSMFALLRKKTCGDLGRGCSTPTGTPVENESGSSTNHWASGSLYNLNHCASARK